jgi:LAO/AO transport system kinase
MTHPSLKTRATLARAITLAESTRPDHAKQAQALLAEILPNTGKSVRLGITGVPGVGKSSFIETFGLYLIGQGHKVAVLAVDPSSKRTGGSIMGDKTRMNVLAANDHAFIRPSATGGSLGGVALRTREAMLLCEAAGYDVIIVETVGVGQSETEVADMVDMFLLLLLPGGGDELQGIKKGIVELTDLVIVNKADGDRLAAAKRAKADYTAALRMLTPMNAAWKPKVELCSALEKTGMEAVWKDVEKFCSVMRDAGAFETRRVKQARAWMWKMIEEGLRDSFRRNPDVRAALADTERAVATRKLSPAAAAEQLLGRFFGK